MRQYELMYILDPTLDEDASGALIGKIEGFIKEQGIEVEKTEPWGKRRFAYRLKGHWDGNYILSTLKCPAEAVSEMERRLRVTDGVLRFLTVRTDEQKAKAERRRMRRETQEQARQKRRAERQAKRAAEAPAPTAVAPSEAAPAPTAVAPSEAAPAGDKASAVEET